MKNKSHKRPTAVYRTTVSILLYMVLYLAIIALFTSIIVLSDNLAAKLVSGAMALVMILPIVHTLRHTKDRIVVTPSHLSLTNITTRSKQGDWKTVQKAILPWGDIKDISPNYGIKLTNLQKQPAQRHAILYRLRPIRRSLPRAQTEIPLAPLPQLGENQTSLIFFFEQEQTKIPTWQK